MTDKPIYFTTDVAATLARHIRKTGLSPELANRLDAAVQSVERSEHPTETHMSVRIVVSNKERK